MPDDHYDLAGTGVGVVEAGGRAGCRTWSGRATWSWRMGSSGVHANGFSLVRHVLLAGARMPLEAVVDDLGGSARRARAAHPDPGLRARTACP